jgi:hypothetical protein
MLSRVFLQNIPKQFAGLSPYETNVFRLAILASNLSAPPSTRAWQF